MAPRWLIKQKRPEAPVLPPSGLLPRIVPTPKLLPAVESAYYEGLLKLYHQFRDQLAHYWRNAEKRLRRANAARTAKVLEDYKKLTYQAALKAFDTSIAMGREYAKATIGFDPFVGMEPDLDAIHQSEAAMFKRSLDNKLVPYIEDRVAEDRREALSKSEDLEKQGPERNTFDRVMSFLGTYAGAVLGVYNHVVAQGGSNIIHGRLSPQVIEDVGEALRTMGNIEVEWIGIGDEASCPVCLRMITGSPYGPDEFLSTDIWPQHNTQCGGNCRCFLRYVRRGEPVPVEELVERVQNKSAIQQVGALRTLTNMSVPAIRSTVTRLVQAGGATVAGATGAFAALDLTADQMRRLAEAISQSPVMRRRELWRNVEAVRVGTSELGLTGNYDILQRVIELSSEKLDAPLDEILEQVAHEMGHHIWNTTRGGTSTALRQSIERIRASRVHAAREYLARIDPEHPLLDILRPDTLSAIWQRAVTTRDFSEVGRIISQLSSGRAPTPYNFSALFDDEEYFTAFFTLMARSPTMARVIDHPTEVVFYNTFRRMFEPYAERRLVRVAHPSELNLFRVDLPSDALQIPEQVANITQVGFLRQMLMPPELYRSEFPIMPGTEFVYDLPSQQMMIQLVRDAGLPEGLMRDEFFEHLRGIHVAYDPSDFYVTDRATGELRPLSTGERNALRRAGYISQGDFDRQFGRGTILAYDADERTIYINMRAWQDYRAPTAPRFVVRRQPPPPPPEPTFPDIQDIPYDGVNISTLSLPEWERRHRIAQGEVPTYVPPGPEPPPEPLPLGPADDLDLVGLENLMGRHVHTKYTQQHVRILTHGIGLHNYQMLMETGQLTGVQQAYYDYVRRVVTHMRDKFASLHGTRDPYSGRVLRLSYYERRAEAILRLLERTPGRVSAEVQRRLSPVTARSLTRRARELSGGLIDVGAFSTVSLQSQRDFFSSWFTLYTEDPSRAAYYAPDLVRVVREDLPDLVPPAPFSPQLRPQLDERVFMGLWRQRLRIVSPHTLSPRALARVRDRPFRALHTQLPVRHPLLMDPQYLNAVSRVRIATEAPPGLILQVGPREMQGEYDSALQSVLLVTPLDIIWTPDNVNVLLNLTAHEVGHGVETILRNIRAPEVRTMLRNAEAAYDKTLREWGRLLETQLERYENAMMEGKLPRETWRLAAAMQQGMTAWHRIPYETRLNYIVTTTQRFWRDVTRGTTAELPDSYALVSFGEYFARIFESYTRGGDPLMMVSRVYPETYNMLQYVFPTASASPLAGRLLPPVRRGAVSRAAVGPGAEVLSPLEIEERARALAIEHTAQELARMEAAANRALHQLPIYIEREALFEEQGQIWTTPLETRDPARGDAISARIQELGNQLYRHPLQQQWYILYSAREYQRTRAELLRQLEADRTSAPQWNRTPGTLPDEGGAAYRRRLGHIQTRVHGTDMESLNGILRDGLRPGSALDLTPDKSWAGDYPVTVVVPSARRGMRIEHNEYYQSANQANVAKVILDVSAYIDGERAIRQFSSLAERYPLVEFEIIHDDGRIEVLNAISDAPVPGTGEET